VTDSLPILHLDEHVVVVAKPAGLLVHRTASRPGEEALLQRLRDQLGRRVFPVQRLDRMTSGALAYALDPDSARALQASLAAPDAVKEYLALVRGLPPEELDCRAPLADERGIEREARTVVRRLAFLPELRASLVRARLHTGRGHQVRRHLALGGHPVLGDPRYGKARANRLARRAGLARIFLHAWQLGFAHPVHGERVSAVAPLAADLCAVLDAVRGTPAAAGNGSAPLRRP
jgi:tRNA pseudouridine65 synthase